MPKTNEIIDCGGKYEVHPMADKNGNDNGSWGVVNSESGDVRCTVAMKDEAVKIATDLNAE